jgi:hypothetical protein
LLTSLSKIIALLESGTMSKVDELKTEIESWDKELDADSEAGKCDFLVREALDAKAKKTLKDL